MRACIASSSSSASRARRESAAAAGSSCLLFLLLLRDDIRRPAATRARAMPFLVLPRIARSSRGSAHIHERAVSSAKRVATVAVPRATAAPSLYHLADAMVTLASEACARLGPALSSVERGYRRRDRAGLLLQQPSGEGGGEWHDGHQRARVHSARTSVERAAERGPCPHRSSGCSGGPRKERQGSGFISLTNRSTNTLKM